MTAQLDFFAPIGKPPRLAVKPSARIVTTVDGQRLGQQCARILELLRKRPRLNSDLSAVSLKYTSRISDLRARGFVIKCERVGNDGITKYFLVAEPERSDA